MRTLEFQAQLLCCSALGLVASPVLLSVGTLVAKGV